jgi:hypothetical protein
MITTIISNNTSTGPEAKRVKKKLGDWPDREETEKVIDEWTERRIRAFDEIILNHINEHTE